MSRSSVSDQFVISQQIAQRRQRAHLASTWFHSVSDTNDGYPLGLPTTQGVLYYASRTPCSTQARTLSTDIQVSTRENSFQPIVLIPCMASIQFLGEVAGANDGGEEGSERGAQEGSAEALRGRGPHQPSPVGGPAKSLKFYTQIRNILVLFGIVSARLFSPKVAG